MKLLVTPEFTAKLNSLDPKSRPTVANLISYIESAENISSLANHPNFKELVVNTLENQLFMIRLGAIRLICSSGKDQSGEYLLLLDIIHYGESRPTSFFATRNPNTNLTLNPFHNTSINPKYNSSLNPKYNASINPKFTASLNPKFNSSLNPKYNASINPKFNASINPKFNTALNPRFNTAINPRFNMSYGGPFVYDLQMVQEAFVVRANNDVILLFGMDAQHKAFGVKNHVDGYAIFDLENNWTEYLVLAAKEGYLRFDPEGTWIGIVV